MRTLKVAALAGSLLAVCGTAGAAEFAMMETAERIADGTFKLSGFPVVVDRDRAAGNDTGFVVGLGYGLPYNLDIEGQVAGYDDGTFLGADLEWNAWRQGRLAFSMGGGLHGADLDGSGYAAGADGTLILSYNPIERLSLSAALDASYDDVNNRELDVKSEITLFEIEVSVLWPQTADREGVYTIRTLRVGPSPPA